MEELAVVTVTKTGAGRLLQRSKSSIIDFGGTMCHITFLAKTPEDFVEARIQSLMMARYICFVDDDDIVVNNSIMHCLDAIKTHNCGIAFTDEALVNFKGKILSTREGVRTYEEVRANPHRMHHLSMIDTQCVDIGKIRSFHPTAIDIAIREAALCEGAVHVPIIGYHWTQHSGQMSKTLAPEMYELNIPLSGPIPQWINRIKD